MVTVALDSASLDLIDDETQDVNLIRINMKGRYGTVVEEMVSDSEEECKDSENELYHTQKSQKQRSRS